MPLLVPEQRTEAWKAAHVGRITGSIAAACLGIDNYCSRQKAWRKIKGIEPESTWPGMEYGNQHEPIARIAYEVETGNLVQETGFWVWNEEDWLGASPDGIIGLNGLLEIKCLASLPTRVPAKYLIQCRIQCLVTGRPWCDFFVWHPEGTFLRRIHQAPTVGIAGLVMKLDEFRRKYVVADQEPERKKPRRRPGGNVSTRNNDEEVL